MKLCRSTTTGGRRPRRSGARRHRGANGNPKVVALHDERRCRHRGVARNGATASRLAESRRASRSRKSSCWRRWRDRPNCPARRPIIRPTSKRWRNGLAAARSRCVCAIVQNRRSRNFLQSQFGYRRSLGRHSAPVSRSPQRSRSRAGDDHRQVRQRYSAGEGARLYAGYCLGLDMTVRGSEDRSFRKSVDGYAVLGP